MSGDLEINFCTLSDGIYSLCVIDEEGDVGISVPDVGTSVPITLQSKENGLAGWAIALIVILVLSLVCCGGYAIAVMCFGVANCFQDHDNNKGKDIQNNIYMDERRGPVDYERRLAIMDGRSGDNESRAAISYEQRQTPQASAVRDDLLEDLSFHGSFKSYKRKTSRDPTMYIPGQEGRPDPIDFHGSNDRSGRMYSEEPPLKPKREPTMYVDGKVEDQRINNVVYENDYSDDDGVYNDYERNASNSMTSRQYYGRSSGNHQHRDSAGGRSAFSSHHSRSSSTANRSTVYSG